MNTLAPIVLFVYNRPYHTQQTLETLVKNKLADQSTLFIYADGPKSNIRPEEINNIETVRKIIRERKWCKEVHIIESEVNKGLAKSIIEGVTQVVNQYGKIIVLEDDLVLSEGFLKYMNDALAVYQDQDKVMHISGYMFPVKGNLPETFFFNSTSCWGWGTWARAWNYFNSNAEELYNNIILSRSEKKFNSRFPYSLAHLKANVEGSLHTWAIKWHTSVFLNNGFCLHPAHTLVQNIGNDSSGVNSVKTDAFFHDVIAPSVSVNKIPEIESPDACKAMQLFYKRVGKVSFINQVRNFSYRFVDRSLRNKLKKRFEY